MTRLQHLWRAIVGNPRPSHDAHTMDCHPSNCDISFAEFRTLREHLSERSTIEELRTALRPLAHMHIEGAPPEFIICTRRNQHPQELQYTISMADCARAFYLLDDHNI